MGTFAGRQDVSDLPSNMRAKLGRPRRGGGEQPRVPTIDIAGPLSPCGQRVPQWLKSIAVVERDGLNAAMLPQRRCFAAFSPLEGEKARSIAGSQI